MTFLSSLIEIVNIQKNSQAQNKTWLQNSQNLQSNTFKISTRPISQPSVTEVFDKNGFSVLSSEQLNYDLAKKSTNDAIVTTPWYNDQGACMKHERQDTMETIKGTWMYELEDRSGEIVHEFKEADLDSRYYFVCGYESKFMKLKPKNFEIVETTRNIDTLHLYGRGD